MKKEKEASTAPAGCPIRHNRLIIIRNKFNFLPELKRPNLSNAILYEIKRKELGDDCDTANTNITVKTGPLMVKVSGDYDLVDHIR